MYGNAIIGGVISVVTGVIGIVIVDSVIAGTAFTTSAILNTVTNYIPVLMGLGLFGAAAFVFWSSN